MKRFIEGEDRQQITLLPDCLDDYIAADNPVRVVEVFVDELDLTALGFAGTVPEATGRPAYHPATLLKIYLYGYLNRVPSSRRLERESQRNVELPDAMKIRRQTVKHPFGTLKAWMGATHFLTRTLAKVRTEMSLQVLAYNMKRMIQIFGVGPLLTAIRA